MSDTAAKTKSNHSAQDPEIDAITKVLAAMEPLTPDARDRVAKWINAKLGMTTFGASKSGAQTEGSHKSTADRRSHANVETDSDLPPKALLWMRQYSVGEEDLAEVFHLAGEETAVLVTEMPGSNERERVMNAYMLSGIAELLKTGSPNFPDQTARDLCISAGCYDRTNHAKRVKGKEMVGSTSKGWTLTAPGLKKAAATIKAMGTQSA